MAHSDSSFRFSPVEGDHSLEPKTVSPIDPDKPKTNAITIVSSSPKYRLYKRRFVGLVGLVRLFIHS